MVSVVIIGIMKSDLRPPALAPSLRHTNAVGILPPSGAHSGLLLIYSSTLCSEDSGAPHGHLRGFWGGCRVHGGLWRAWLCSRTSQAQHLYFT